MAAHVLQQQRAHTRAAGGAAATAQRQPKPAACTQLELRARSSVSAQALEGQCSEHLRPAQEAAWQKLAKTLQFFLYCAVSAVCMQAVDGKLHAQRAFVMKPQALQDSPVQAQRWAGRRAPRHLAGESALACACDTLGLLRQTARFLLVPRHVSHIKLRSCANSNTAAY